MADETRKELISILSKVHKSMDTTRAMDDFLNSFKTALDTLLSVKQSSAKEALDIHAKLLETFNLTTADLQTKFETLKSSIKSGDKGDKGEKGDKGDKGDTGDVGPQGPKGDKGDTPELPQFDTFSPELVRNELDALPPDQQPRAIIELKDAQTNLTRRMEEIANKRMTPSGPVLYVNGAKKGRAQTVNLVPGTGVTLTYSYANGRNDVTINATGTGTFGIITVTGTIDDSNTSFTSASEPTLVVVNGTSYRHGKGVTISGTAITLDNPVGSGGDIYAL